jgi:curved DNA-binding protein CbpA
METTYSLYDVLELKSDATPRDIKNAYYRLVRKYPPEKEPEQFKKIRAAYETLSDPAARSSYDSIAKYGDEIRNLFEEAEVLMEQENWQSASVKLKRILVLAPEIDAARNLLGLCLINLENWTDAQKTYEVLTSKHPDIPVYWGNFGYAYKNEAEYFMSRNNSFAARSLFEKARDSFKRQISIEKYNIQPYIAISDTYVSEKDYEKALYWAEKAVNISDINDLAKFHALFQICIIYLYKGDCEKIEKVAQRIEAIIPQDKSIRDYVAFRFFDFAFELFKVNAYEQASSFIKSARKFSPDNTDLIKFEDSCNIGKGLSDQFTAFLEDKQILPPLKAIGQLYASDFINQPVENRDKFFEEVMKALDTWPPGEILFSVNRIKNQYNFVYKLNPKFFDILKETIEKEGHKVSSGVSSSGKSEESPGCSTIILGIILLFTFPPVGIILLIVGIIEMFSQKKQ